MRNSLLNYVQAIYSKYVPGLLDKIRYRFYALMEVKYLYFFIFHTKICTSTRASGCKEIDAVSEELKSIH